MVLVFAVVVVSEVVSDNRMLFKVSTGNEFAIAIEEGRGSSEHINDTECKKRAHIASQKWFHVKRSCLNDKNNTNFNSFISFSCSLYLPVVQRV